MLRRFFASSRWVTGEPMHSGARLLDLLQMAAHRDGRVVKLQSGRVSFTLKLKRGEFVAASRYLAERWGLDRRQVRRDLAGWVADGTLESVPANVPANVPAKPCVYRFVNYDAYQPAGLPVSPQVSPQTSPIVERSKKNKKKPTSVPEARETWVSPYLAAWADRNGGVRPTAGPYLKAVSTILRATGHGHDRVLRAWRDYLGDHAGKKWCSVFHFRDHYGEYDPDAPAVGDGGVLTAAGQRALARVRGDR